MPPATTPSSSHRPALWLQRPSSGANPGNGLVTHNSVRVTYSRAPLCLSVADLRLARRSRLSDGNIYRAPGGSRIMMSSGNEAALTTRGKGGIEHYPSAVGKSDHSAATRSRSSCCAKPTTAQVVRRPARRTPSTAVVAVLEGELARGGKRQLPAAGPLPPRRACLRRRRVHPSSPRRPGRALGRRRARRADGVDQAAIGPGQPTSRVPRQSCSAKTGLSLPGLAKNRATQSASRSSWAAARALSTEYSGSSCISFPLPVSPRNVTGGRLR